jgi:uncharacterized protein YdeI (YjbR/CyaY-like superfamily)
VDARVAPTFFASAAEFRQWLERQHAAAREILLGFHRKSAGRPGLSYAEALEEALCFGWIDGVRKNRDATSYTIRFTPRKAGSIWSNVNVAHVARLTELGRMRPAGLAAFAARSAAKTGVYSFEAKQPKAFSPAFAKRFRADAAAWAAFCRQPAWYRRKATWWVMSAKQSATRERRLERLIAAMAAGRQI